MTTFTITIDEKNKYIADYFSANKIDQSQLTFDQLLTVLEDAEDYAAAMEARLEQEQNPDHKNHTLQEVADELGITL